MVNFLLCLQAQLENIASVAPGEHHRWTLDLKESGGSEEKLGVVVFDEEQHEMAGGTGTAHFVVRRLRESLLAPARSTPPGRSVPLTLCSLVLLLQGRQTVQHKRHASEAGACRAARCVRAARDMRAALSALRR